MGMIFLEKFCLKILFTHLIKRSFNKKLFLSQSFGGKINIYYVFIVVVEYKK